MFKVSWIGAAIKAYGPHSYGLVTILILWFAIGQPGLESQRSISSEQAKTAQVFLTASDNLARQSEALEVASIQLNKATERIERSLERLESKTLPR